jgi:tellurite resistance protein
LYLVAVVAYLGKVFRRPGALVDDLRIMPGRAGISTAGMAAMLLSATLVPYSGGLAKVTLILALGAHLLVVLLVLKILWNAPFLQRRMTPVWHLTFVGVIVVPVAAVALGWSGLAEVIYFLSIAMALTIWAGNLIGMVNSPVPPPLRPTIAIHLAPLSLLGIASSLLGYETMTLVFGLGAILLAVTLVIYVRYLTVAGFSPFWGAFTFPVVSFATLMLILAQSDGGLFRLLAGLALIGATLSTPPIAYRIIKMWASGSLAAKTNAAQA